MKSMNKSQKIWLWISILLFIIPEILWSSIGNVLYSFFQSGKINPSIFRNNFLLEYKNESLLKLFIIIQLFSIISAMFCVIKCRKNIPLSLLWISAFVFSIFLIMTVFIFYLLMIFNPSFP